MEDDPEYVELVREALIQSKKPPKEGISMKDWSALRDLGADVIDELRMLRSTIIAANGGNSNPKPVERPTTLMMDAAESAKITRRRIKHENLVEKLVPKKQE